MTSIPRSWTWASSYPAPAKLNLFLHVTGRRKDGYHTLQTLFRFLDFADYLRFSPEADGKLCLQNPQASVLPEDDLTLRAARLLQKETGTRKGASIFLEKNLPMGAGLGGGSSDAATVLMALNHLWETGLSQADLQTMGLSLGADVPVFLFGQNAFAEGIGEVLSPVSLRDAWYLLFTPSLHVPTQAIFKDAHLKRDTPAISKEDWYEGFGINDLELVASSLFPELKAMLDTVRRFAPTRMTGSGSAFFSAFSEIKKAKAVLRRLPAHLARHAHIIQGRPAHPLATLF